MSFSAIPPRAQNRPQLRHPVYARLQFWTSGKTGNVNTRVRKRAYSIISKLRSSEPCTLQKTVFSRRGCSGRGALASIRHNCQSRARMLPDAAGVHRIHGLALGAAEGLAELVEVLHRAVDAPAAGRVRDRPAPTGGPPARSGSGTTPAQSPGSSAAPRCSRRSSRRWLLPSAASVSSRAM